jgi:3-hydroxybutyryl-CoA dehydratase
MSSEAPVVPSVVRMIDQARVNEYAIAGHDQNPLHLVSPEAEASQFGKPIAHGMLVLALVSEAMSTAFGERWAEGGHLKVRWRAPAIPPVTITASAELKRTDDGVATYDVACTADDGTVLLTGTARAPID